jgi:dCTP deaminase
MVLSDEDIIQLCVGGPDESLIDPFNQVLVKPASYDVRLGKTFIRFPNDSRDHVIDLADPTAGGEVHVVQPGEAMVLEPGEFALAETFEWVNIPNGIVARVEGKSTTGRSGLMVHVTAGYIDPGFKGRITLEVCALRGAKLRLTPGQKIAQLSFLRMTAPARHPYAGRYQNAAGPEAVKDEVPYGFALPVTGNHQGAETRPVPDRIIRADGIADEVHVFVGKPHVVVPGGGSFKIATAPIKITLTDESRDRVDIDRPDFTWPAGNIEALRAAYPPDYNHPDQVEGRRWMAAHGYAEPDDRWEDASWPLRRRVESPACPQDVEPPGIEVPVAGLDFPAPRWDRL